MANMRRSVATIDSPEFVNINSISPLVSKCEIKVFYLGANRNRSFISKEVAKDMAQTLPGCPIVGYYIENKEDFGDHGEQVIIDSEGVKFKNLTKPYGFVAPDSKVWFQKFMDTDEFGNETEREYLMTEGYLWTGQFPEVDMTISNENPQSMELDQKTLKGHWSTDNNKGVDFFIINDAIISKLCILGEDVEPCFEGSRVTAPSISSSFSKNDDFNKDLFTMMEQLKFALNKEGGLSMHDVNQPAAENTAIENNFSQEEGKVVENTAEETKDTSVDFKKEEEDPKKKDEEEKDSGSEGSDSKDAPSKEEDDKKKKKEEDYACGGGGGSSEKDDKKKKYELDNSEILEELNTLKAEFSALKEENAQLVAFKAAVDKEKKEELIKTFYMLSDEDKKEVVENMDKYSLDDIEAKLSVICVRKKVNFNLEDTDAEQEAPATVFNLDAHQADDTPAWLKAVQNNRSNND